MWSTLIGCARGVAFHPEARSFFSGHRSGERCFSFWCVLPKSIWSNVVASFLESFLGIVATGGICLAFLEEREAADETATCFRNRCKDED